MSNQLGARQMAVLREQYLCRVCNHVVLCFDRGDGRASTLFAFRCMVTGTSSFDSKDDQNIGSKGLCYGQTYPLVDTMMYSKGQGHARAMRSRA